MLAALLFVLFDERLGPDFTVQITSALAAKEGRANKQAKSDFPMADGSVIALNPGAGAGGFQCLCCWLQPP
jgi:hypothetical protein